MVLLVADVVEDGHDVLLAHLSSNVDDLEQAEGVVTALVHLKLQREVARPRRTDGEPRLIE